MEHIDVKRIERRKFIKRCERAEEYLRKQNPYKVITEEDIEKVARDKFNFL